MSTPLSLSVWPLNLSWFNVYLRILPTPCKKTFFHFLALISLSLSLSLLYALSGSNQTSNYSGALRPGQCVCVCVCVAATSTNRPSNPCWCLLLPSQAALLTLQPVSYSGMRNHTYENIIPNISIRTVTVIYRKQTNKILSICHCSQKR